MSPINKLLDTILLCAGTVRIKIYWLCSLVVRVNVLVDVLSSITLDVSSYTHVIIQTAQPNSSLRASNQSEPLSLAMPQSRNNVGEAQTPEARLEIPRFNVQRRISVCGS